MSGTHGTGKSTNAGNCYFLLNKAGMKFSYLRHQDILDPFGFLLRRVARILGFKNPTDLERTAPFGVLWSIYILFVYFPILAGGIKLRQTLGYSVVADRYVYDMIVGFSGDNVTVPITHLMPRVLPHPDLSFIFDADEGRILKARPEHTPEFVRMEKKLYNEMAEKYGIKRVNTNDPPGVVWSRLFHEIGSVLKQHN